MFYENIDDGIARIDVCNPVSKFKSVQLSIIFS